MRRAAPLVLSGLLVLVVAGIAPAQPAQETGDTQTAQGNKPQRVAWFSELGFGLFIHWSVDSQLGSVISHSLVGADDDYCRRFFRELPRTFHPHRYRPEDWADLARLAGFKYAVFTAKHHSGFCMFRTATTKFGIMHTPYGRDITADYVRAFRSRGIAVGLYFSPDDFWYLHQHGITIGRKRPGVTPQEDKGLMEYDRAQIRELLTQYGPIDLFFIDGPAEGLRELCWELQPNIVVTRGAMNTPEQHVPGVALREPWEACMTMGTQWQYKPTNEQYKSGTELIERLVEVRAKGGNLLLNIGPKPDGEIPIEQESRLREIALWNFINGEAIYGVEPWVVTNEDNIWLTKKRGEDTVYAIITGPEWKYAARREITLGSVRVGPKATVRLVGQNGRVLEYRPTVDPSARWQQDERGLHISAMNAQRIYNDTKWPNAIAIKITDARPALDPPRVATGGAKTRAGGALLSGDLADLGQASAVEVGFQCRPRPDPTQPQAQAETWQESPLTRLTAPGSFSAAVEGLEPGRNYQYRAMVKHPRITLYGDKREFQGK